MYMNKSIGITLRGWKMRELKYSGEVMIIFIHWSNKKPVANKRKKKRKLN